MGPTKTAVERALQYFVLRGDKADPIALLFLEPLRRRHGLTALVPVTTRLDKAAQLIGHPDAQLPLHLRTYARLRSAQALPAEDDIRELNNDLDVLGLESLYCDRRGFKPDLPKRLEALAAFGEYRLTHAAMYLGWARENGCVEEDALTERLASKLEAFIGVAPVADDVRMEAMAVLACLRPKKPLDARWVDLVLSAQRADGGWAHEPAARESNDHSSLMGLWVLLEATRNDYRSRFLP